MKHPDLTDDVIGPLRYDERLDWYGGEWRDEAGSVEFSLNLDDDEGVEPALARARQVLKALAGYTNGAKEYAVSRLLGLKNESWVSEDEQCVTPDEFKGRMTLQSIVFEADGEVTFYHHDGDLFGGHSIEIGMDGNDVFFHADIPG
ncbi:DUF2262 domain-containing protein [Tautonia rosea]|uniref:DUF2262 domain-containing protein n=1 Tax=Tautonia rosea TaxID=2728037 RepID=UPI0014751DE8|nr:DUF2262 domain-containing protein [Tautonia rosea]